MLLINSSSGEHFAVPASKRFVVDGGDIYLTIALLVFKSLITLLTVKLVAGFG
jgi:hypothetical protein